MRQMLVIEAVFSQVRHILQLIKQLEGSEFPYEHSRDALWYLRVIFERHEKGLEESLNTAWLSSELRDIRVPAAAQDIRYLFPVLGFILRSTNVRNAFEVWGPLLRLARSVLGSETRLLLSSEWEFSPYTLVGYKALPKFVLIGFPAYESEAPFLLPIAGHELGHTLWVARGIQYSIRTELQNGIIEAIKSNWDEYQVLFSGYAPEDIELDALASQVWQPAAEFAERQACELFCDFFGLKIFGESFLHAFGYFLGPQCSGSRTFEYPNCKERADVLVRAANLYGITVPDGFQDNFLSTQKLTDDYRNMHLLLKAADFGRRKVESALIARADQEANTAGLVLSSEPQVEQCVNSFRMLVPAEHCGGVADILNAGWRALLTPGLFSNEKHEKGKAELLSDLVLKSLEILEYEERVNTGAE